MIVKSKNYGYFDVDSTVIVSSIGTEDEAGVALPGPARIFVRNDGSITIQPSYSRKSKISNERSGWVDSFLRNAHPDCVFINGQYVWAQPEYEEIVKELQPIP